LIIITRSLIVLSFAIASLGIATATPTVGDQTDPNHLGVGSGAVEALDNLEVVPESDIVSTSAVPEPSRLVLLVLGIGFVSTAYRRAWVNLRQG